MLDKNTTSFPISSACERDQGVQHLIASARIVPFLRIGGVARIEVIGIPALRCQTCHEELYDLALLACIEHALQRRVEQGDVGTSYTFEQLAAELTA